MRLNTASRSRQAVFVYIILILMVAFDFFILSIDGGTLGQTNIRLSYIVGLIFLFLWYRGNPVFTYDSDGEVIIIDSKNPSLIFLGRAFNQRYEFPKRKLSGYSIQKWLFRKKLTLKLNSKDGTRKHVSATMSNLNKQEVKDLERSLRGIISKNKKEGFIADKEVEYHDE